MENNKFKEIVEMLNSAKPDRDGFIMLPSVTGFDVYKLPEDVLRVFLHTQNQLALAENTPMSDKQLAAPAVVFSEAEVCDCRPDQFCRECYRSKGVMITIGHPKQT